MCSPDQIFASGGLEKWRSTSSSLRRRLEPAAQRVPRRVVRCVLVVAVAALVFAVVLRSRSALTPPAHVPHPQPGWLTLAVVAEAVSLLAYALIVRIILGFGEVPARMRTLLRATVSGIAISSSLPGGQAASAAYWYRQLRREGAGSGLAALAMIGSMVAGILSLAGVIVIGVAVAGDHGPLAAARVPILAASVGILVVSLILRRRITGATARATRRLKPADARHVSVGRRDIASIAVLAYANWLLDCTSLYVALLAVHATVPLQSIVLTYAIAQLVASLPLLPGGGGTVEVTLALGFAAFGHTSGSVVAGILLFRLISCWGLVPAGWLAIALEGRRVPTLSVRRARTAALHAA
jgi:uncharacterized membrane protein YbhN (UPF0104 family)